MYWKSFNNECSQKQWTQQGYRNNWMKRSWSKFLVPNKTCSNRTKLKLQNRRHQNLEEFVIISLRRLTKCNSKRLLILRYECLKSRVSSMTMLKEQLFYSHSRDSNRLFIFRDTATKLIRAFPTLWCVILSHIIIWMYRQRSSTILISFSIRIVMHLVTHFSFSNLILNLCLQMLLESHTNYLWL